MWRFILLGVVAVAADDRWSRQATDRRQGDWVPVAAPCPTCNQQFQKGRSFDQDLAAAALPSVLTPPAQQQSRLLPPPPPDNLFQHASSAGFLSNFPNQPQPFNDNKQRQFFTQPNFNGRAQDQSTIRFKPNSQIPDSSGVPSSLFHVGPQQFTHNPAQQTSQLLAIPQFNGAPFIPPPQRTQIPPFVGLNSQILQQNIPFGGFQIPDNPPVFLSAQPGNLPPQSQFNNNQLQQPSFNQLPQSIMQAPDLFTSNVTNNYKQQTQNKGKEEVQLLYVPVETLRQNQRGRNNNNVRNRGNKKVEPSHLNNNFDSLNQPSESNRPIQTPKQIFKQQNIDSGEQFFRQNQNTPTTFQDFQSQNHQVIQETAAPQMQLDQNAFLQQLFQGQSAFAQDQKNLHFIPSTPTPINNKNKVTFEQNPRDSLILNSPQFTYKFQQEPIQQTLKPTTTKLETANQNYYQPQQLSNQDDYETSQEYTQHTLGSEEQQTTMPPPHQPPLSVYMETNANSKITDVLTHLKNAKTIPVLDTIGPDSPQVFVGPSNLNPPVGYLKFELPYLSAIDSNRVERKVDRLPFFVAPLNFQPPPGYSKIPFPAPHIGSVVVSNATILRAALHEKPDEYIPKPETSTQNDVNTYTIPSNISPISPQLPSLVNSLQDERYFPTTTEIPATTPILTPVNTTPYRRNPGRGSHRAHITTSTETPVTRRTVSRQRRPHSRPNSSYRNSQVVSTSTTPEPIAATTLNSQYENQNEEQKLYAEVSTEIPQVYNQNLREQAYDSSNRDNGEFKGNNQKQIYNGQTNFNNNQQNDQVNENGQNFNNVLQLQGISQSEIPQLAQVQQYFTQLQQQQYLQGNNHQKQKQQPQLQASSEQGQEQQRQNQYLQENYQIQNQNSDFTSQTAQNPVNNEQYFNNNNNNQYTSNSEFISDSPQLQTTENIVPKVTAQTTERTTVNNNKYNHFRRDPLRQRYRGKNQYQTTTEQVTTQAEQVAHPQRVKHRPHYKQNVQIIRETTNNYPNQDNYPTNTERLDEQSPTERNQGSQLNEHNTNYYNNDQKQFVNLQNQNYQNRPSLNSNGQFYQEQFNINQQKPSQYVQNEQQFNTATPKPSQYNKNEQQINENNEQIQVQLENSTPYTQIKETLPVFNANVHNSQQIFSDTSSRYEEHDHVTEKPINQQRLTKYTRLRGNANTGIRDNPQADQVNHYNLDTSVIRQNNNYESQTLPSFSSSPSAIDNNRYTTEGIAEGITDSEQEQIITTTTPKPVVVRVRGRVRNRQRLNGVRHTTTTEAPNYPVGSGLETNSDTQYSRKPSSHRLSNERNNYNRHNSYKYRNSNSQNNYNSNNNNNNNENSENDSSHVPSSTASLDEEVTVNSITTTSTELPVSRKYNHILNRNIVRRINGNRQTNPTTTTSPPHSGSTTKYLVRTTRRPTTQVTKLSDGKPRIRRPNKLALTTTTTEYTPLNQAQDSFAPSAASNEVLDPYYSSQANYNSENNINHHVTSNHNYQTLNRSPVRQFTPSSYESSTVLTPTPFAPAQSSDDDNFYWNQGVTIQQSNSYDFSAESSPVTQSTLNTHYTNEGDEYNHRSSPSWDNPSTHSHDQTPYSSNEQYVATYSKNKLKQSPQSALSGKENRWNEKVEEKGSAQIDEQLQQQQEQKPQQYGGEQNVNVNEEQHNYYDNKQNQYQNQEYVTDRTAYQTNYPADTISEQTENNKYVSSANEEVKTNYKSDFSNSGHQIHDDSVGDKENLNNVQQKPVDPVSGKKSGRRRGAWVRVRVNKKPKDVFEAAESQNLASITNDNAIKSAESKDQSDKQWTVPSNHRPTDPYSTDLPQTTSQVVSPTTTTETPVTIKNDENFQKSIADMIREIIKDDENEEVEEENRKLKNNAENMTSTSTLSPDTATEISGTISTLQEELAVTVIPEVATQVVPLDSEGVTAINDDIITEVNTLEPRVLGTSTTTEISLETEICYRGRCVKSKKDKKPLKSLFPSYRSSSSSLASSSTGAESDLMSVE